MKKPLGRGPINENEALAREEMGEKIDEIQDAIRGLIPLHLGFAIVLVNLKPELNDWVAIGGDMNEPSLMRALLMGSKLMQRDLEKRS